MKMQSNSDGYQNIWTTEVEKINLIRGGGPMKALPTTTRMISNQKKELHMDRLTL